MKIKKLTLKEWDNQLSIEEENLIDDTKDKSEFYTQRDQDIIHKKFDNIEFVRIDDLLKDLNERHQIAKDNGSASVMLIIADLIHLVENLTKGE